MTTLITYSDDRMTKSAEVCRLSALRNNCQHAIAFTPGVIDNNFRTNNAAVLKAERGAGYWLWKPYVINETIKQMHDGDILIWCDAGVEVTNNVNFIIERMREPIFFFTNGFNHADWCKADCLVDIIPMKLSIRQTNEKNFFAIGSIAELKQVQASVIFFRINQFVRDFVKEWLLWCQMPYLIDDSKSREENVLTFQEHRHDQAILTCLQIKYDFDLHWWPDKHWITQRHRWPQDDYPVIFNHHRKRNNEWT